MPGFAVNVCLVLYCSVALTLKCILAARGVSEEKLIGWKGEAYRSSKNGTDAHVLPRLETISWSPRAFVYHNFASKEELQHIIRVAAPQMRRSQVVQDDGNGSAIDEYRTSYGTFLRRMADPVISKVQQRVSEWVHLPVVNQEDMQVLRYGVGQKYGAHLDSLDDDSARVATVLIYLKDTEFGGETSFPSTTSQAWVNPQRGADLEKEFSDCAKGHVAYRPKAGDALLFWSIKPDGVTEDPKSEHEGCPVLRGVKWTATVWVHPVPFRPETFQKDEDDDEADPGICNDQHTKCKRWANQGDCEKNQPYMVGNMDVLGHCRKSCKMCEECTAKDTACYNRNREKAGFLVYDPAEYTTA